MPRLQRLHAMTPEHWQEIEDALQQALELDRETRQVWLQEMAEDNPGLAREVESLLKAHDEADTFLESQAAKLLPGWEQSLADHPPFDRIGPYRLLEELGRGGMSVVYLAERDDEQFEQRVAVKLLKRGLDTESVLRRFRSERQILATLNHPNIAQLHDGGTTDDGLPYFVIEAIDGTHIDRYCAEHQLKPRQRLRLVQQICDAVHYAHRNLIVHRDIKPSNILVTADGTPKLLDFGIAKLLAPENFPQTVETTLLGPHPMTPQYASPEQLRGERVTTASDVFSLGMLLHKLLLGRLPKRLGDTAVTPSRLELPTDLANIVRMALRDEPERRYASAEQLADDLKRFERGLPVRAQTDTLGYRLSKFLQRHRLAVATAAIFLLTIFAFVFVLMKQVEETRHERERAELERDNAEEVSNLLFDLFRTMDPMQSQGAPITVEELVDQGLHRVETELGDQQAVQATALQTIGKVYWGLGQHGRAAEILQRALNLRREALGPEDLEVAATQTLLGELLSLSGQFERAEKELREALALRRQKLAPNHPLVAATQTELAVVVWRQGRFEEAETLNRQTLEMLRGQQPTDDETLGNIINNLSTVLFDLDKLDEAEKYAMEAVVIFRRVYGENHSEVGKMLHNLALPLTRQNRFDEAEPLMREALGIYRNVYGEDHPGVAYMMASLGVLLTYKGDLDEAEELLRRALSVRENLPQPENPVHMLSNMSAIGLVLHEKGRFADAREWHEKAVARAADAMPKGHPARSILDLRYGRTLIALDQLDEAEPRVRAACASRRSTLPVDSPQIAECLEVLGQLSMKRQSFAETEALLLESWEILQPQAQEQRRQVRRVQERLVALYETWGRPDDAAPYRQGLQNHE